MVRRKRRTVTAYLDDELIAALDDEVASGRARSRAAATAHAVAHWAAARGEQGIVDSYRRRYAVGAGEVAAAGEFAESIGAVGA